MVDAADLKSASCNGSVGSSPSLGTLNTPDFSLSLIIAVVSASNKLYGIIP